nr:type II toxin-antitoxin system RelB/DinJ family antitoxin [Sphingomonas bacterium]
MEINIPPTHWKVSCKNITCDVTSEGTTIMVASALVQTRIDPAVKARAAEVLEAMGMTVSDAVRILLTRTAREGAIPIELTIDQVAYDSWFRAKVQEALDDPRPDIPHEDVETEFAARRAATLRKLGDA